jgi:hypothetical protein
MSRENSRDLPLRGGDGVGPDRGRDVGDPLNLIQEFRSEAMELLPFGVPEAVSGTRRE